MTTTDDSYAARAREFGIATADEIRHAYAQPETMVLDVRGPGEITASIDRAVQTTCTADGCDELAADPTQFVPDRSATVIIYCKSGRRAGKAKALLIAKGYTGTILNAGGYDDIKAVLMT